MDRIDRRRSPIVWLTALLVLLLAGASPTLADEITLVNGDRLIGRVASTDADSVVIEHPVLGWVTIRRADVAAINGTPGPATAAPGADVEIPAAAAAAVATPAGEPSGATGDEPDPTPEGEPGAPAEAAADDDWKFSLRLGLNVSQGNTDTLNLTLGATAKHETDRERTFIDAQYFVNRSDGTTDDNKFFLTGQHDWLVPESRWYWFVRGRFDYDQFQSWDYRVSGHIGPGYELVKREALKWDVLAGVGVQREWGSDNPSLEPEALLGTTLEWQINESQQFILASTIFPALGDVGEFRTLTSARWTMSLGANTPLSMNISLQHEYQSQVDPGNDRNDLRVTAGVQYDF